MAALETVVVHKIDAEKGEGIELSEDFAVSGFPTFVLVDSEGREIDRWLGFGGVDRWIATFEAAKADPTTVADKMARFDARPTEDLAATLARIFRARGEYREAVRYWRDAEELAGSGYALEIFRDTRYGMKDESFAFEDVLAAAERVRSEESGDAESLLTIARGVAAAAAKAGDPEAAVPFLEPALDASAGSDDPDLASARREVEILHALYVTGDDALAVSLKKESMPEGWSEDAGELNAFAWWCFENEVNLEEAEDLARRGVEIVEPGSRKAAILDTVAEIRNLRGDPAEAVELMEAAVAEDPDNEYWSGQLARFRTLLNERGF